MTSFLENHIIAQIRKYAADMSSLADKLQRLSQEFEAVVKEIRLLLCNSLCILKFSRPPVTGTCLIAM